MTYDDSSSSSSGNSQRSFPGSVGRRVGCLRGLSCFKVAFSKLPDSTPSQAKLRQSFAPVPIAKDLSYTVAMYPIAKDLVGGRKMTEREFERVFQIPGNGHGGDEPPIPTSCNIDIEKRLTVVQVIASIEEFDKQRLRQAESIRQLNYPGQAQAQTPGAISWRLPIGDHGHGITITIAQQLVYIGNVSFISRRQRTVDIMNHLLDTDPNLAWGRQRFANGQAPDVTISLACYKARYDLVEAMAFHPSADYYLPTWAPMLERPCPKLCLVALIAELTKYNNGRGNDERRKDRDRCVEVLMRLHKRRHGLEQRILERVLMDRVGCICGKVMSKKLISY